VFHIPKILNELEVSDWQWWLVFVNAKKEKYSIALELSDDPESPLENNLATYTVDYAMSIKAGAVQFALEAINAGTGGAIDNEWHTLTYETKVKETLQGNQAEYAETESDIISELLIEVRNKVNQLVGGATPTPVASVSAMTDPSKLYLLTTDGEWYYHNGTQFVSGGVYGAGVVDSVPTQGSTNAVSSGGVYDALHDTDTTLTQSGQAADAKVVGNKIVDLSDGKFSLSHTLFSQGGLESDGSLNNKLYYVSTNEDISFDYPVQINLVDSSVYSITRLLIYDADNQSYESATTVNTINGWVIPANTKFKFQIFKTGTYQNADISEFAQQVIFETRANYLAKINAVNLSLMQVDGSELLPVYFRRGGVSGGNFVSYVYYRIANPDITYFDRDVKIIAKSGFKFGVHLYNSDGTYNGDKGWKTSYVMPANQKFRLIIARSTENSSERADVWEFYSAINIQSSFKDYVDSKNTLLKTAFMQSGRAKLAAHMGYHVNAPENTTKAFIAAGQNGYWGIESDVQQTSDGYYVMCHDSTVDRTTDGSGSISQMTLAEVRALHITADTSLKIPTFEEYLAICKRYGCVPIIELKGTITNTKESYLKIFGIVKSFGLLDGCIFIGSKYALFNFKSASEEVPFMPVYQNGGGYDWDTEFANVSQYKNVGLDWDYNLGVSLNHAKSAHAKGMLYGIFTVDNAENVMTAFENGADFVTTNTILPTS